MSGRNPRPTSACRQTGGVTAVASRRPPAKAQVKTTIPKKGPPPRSPKKVDYKQPGMTKAMAQRLKHAQELQKELERKEREKTEAAQKRRPKRTAAPVGGDARMGRERRPGPGAKSRPTSKEPPPCPPPEAPPEPVAGPSGRRPPPGGCPRPGRSAAPGKVPAKTRKLASSINADIVQAEPLESGTVDQVIIPPGTLNPEKTTIVSIPQPAQPQSPVMQQPHSQIHESSHIASSTMAPGSTSIANRSAQVISESLDEQDAAESAVVNNKLQDLQQARRDFVMAVANVGGNSVNLGEFPMDDLANVTPITDITPPMMMMTPESSSPQLMNCPDVESPYLIPEYAREHPIVEAAREYLRSRQTERRLEEDFARIAGEPLEDDVPDEPQYFDVCRPAPAGLPAPIFDDEDSDDEYNPYDPFATPPHYVPVPKQAQRYDYGANAMEELERFVDLKNYPPSPRPPAGREQLHPTLWDYPDIWAKLAPEPPGAPCLMDFSSSHRSGNEGGGGGRCPRTCPDD